VSRSSAPSMPVDQAPQRVEIERAVVRHGRDYRNQAASDPIHFCHFVSAAIISDTRRIPGDVTINHAF